MKVGVSFTVQVSVMLYPRDNTGSGLEELIEVEGSPIDLQFSLS